MKKDTWRSAVSGAAAGAANGLGGGWFRGVRVVWLRRAFGLLLLYGGARCLM